jgi:Uma2 family endonuclease
VAYASTDRPLVKIPGPGAAFLDGPPILAVEIVSPSDTYEKVAVKILEYLNCGVPIVWLAEPTFRTILASRPDREPDLYNARHDLTAEPTLPGFRVAVARIFDA